ncbi:MAG: glycogen synthase GlgA [Planctomycetia bacterium]|nr:glycogen synthase GlgA [Planctomycetia bacterium]
MNILIASSEAAPLAKTGGLADVCGALPKALRALGHEATLILPAYRSTKKFPTEPTGVEIKVCIGGKEVRGTYLKCSVPEIAAPVYLVEHNMYYDRAGLYNENNVDYGDNCERFVFFAYAVLEAVRLLNLKVDILHLNDWQTGLVAALQAIFYRDYPGYEKIATLFTIHNIAYQGSFPAEAMSLTGLHWKYFNWLQMECCDQLNLLKTGLVFSDGITTVSPSYAEEITQSPGGCGLEGVLHNRKDVLWGIANGIDVDVWNSEKDAFLPSHFSLATLEEGKRACKTALQEEMGLPVCPETPLVGLVGRLTEQKGFDLAIELAYRKMAEGANMQWIFLGTGDALLERKLKELAQKYPNNVAASIQYSNELAHRIIAGCDIFLMPSRFEPCGLTQLYSYQYGTVPVVHATGGLIDTVCDLSDETIANHTATGIRFNNADMEGITWGLNRALDVYANQQEVWRQMQKTGMQLDVSWAQSAEKYVEIYKRIQRKFPRGN